MVINATKKGKITRNQATCLYPALQIEFNTNVQKAIEINLTKNTKAVDGTGHSKLPTQ